MIRRKWFAELSKAAADTLWLSTREELLRSENDLFNIVNNKMDVRLKRILQDIIIKFS